MIWERFNSYSWVTLNIEASTIFPPVWSVKSIFDVFSNLLWIWNYQFSNFSYMFLNPNNFFQAFCYQKLFWPFNVWINCSRDLKNFANSRSSASNFKSFSKSLEHFFLTKGQNNLVNKMPFLYLDLFGESLETPCFYSLSIVQI